LTLTELGSTPSTAYDSAQNRIELPSCNPPLEVSSGDTSESLSPIATASTASTAPAHGPAAPISNITRRVRAGDRIRINAPKVPMKKTDGRGAGMKYGGLTSTLLRRATR
jgi:hypothetical protein